MRNNDYLVRKLNDILTNNFSDKILANPIEIRFGRKAACRLGSIRKQEKVSLIMLTGYFQDERVPEELIEVTVAHELAHYFHGFCSDHKKISDHPHRGRLVDRELINRGFGDKLIFQRKWLKTEWPKLVRN